MQIKKEMEGKKQLKQFNDFIYSNYIFFIQKGNFIISYNKQIYEIIVNKISPITSENKLKCLFPNCGNLLASKQLLLTHLRTHYGVKPFICNFCSKSFNDRGNLKNHIRIHTGERPFKCSLCDKSFKTEGQLREHLKTHFKDKPFQCPHCHKFYKRKGVLKIHMLIHKDEPSFIQKKDIYEKMVNGLDNKSFSYIFDPQIYKNYNSSNNLTINSTKDDSHIILNINQNEDIQDEDVKNITVFQRDKILNCNNNIKEDLYLSINEQEDKDEKSQYCLNEINNNNITTFPLLEEIM